LLVVGDGPTCSRLRASAPSNAEFLGRVSDETLADLYARCRALVHPQEEDFGIAAVEAQAAGTPVIAFAAGGALDTVRPLLTIGHGGKTVETEIEVPTGVYFEHQNVAALVAAVEAFELAAERFDARQIRAHAERFGCERFHAELAAEIESATAAATGAKEFNKRSG
jgi:glycosyltransferase involved in cell wall biosynthesis